mmetsp:Transcript_1780/g.2319  ORF Transcript_1780/g.2319 Transcript_1780/m.2319 type:complete len:100 (-) Transcript_1780:35-334(-)
MDEAIDITKTTGDITYGTINNNDYSYTGELLNGVPHGYGRQTYFSSNNVYEGQFDNGKCDGFTMALYNDGTYYIGLWKADVRTKGKLFDKNGCLDEIIN